jgi:hypothetical protein
MAEMSENQKFHLLLADIAMAAAIKTSGSTFTAPPAGFYEPGVIRDHWLATASDAEMKRKVLALANAGVASLQGVDPDQLAKAAEKYGIPIDDALAGRIALHFNDKREAVIRYRS